MYLKVSLFILLPVFFSISLGFFDDELRLYDDEIGGEVLCKTVGISPKEDWCNENVTTWYKCNDDEKKAMKDELKTFNEFMDKIREYEKVKTTRNTVECKSKDEIIPIEVTVEDVPDYFDSLGKLYEAHLDDLTKCNNCTVYNTPFKFSKCVVPVRESMIAEAKTAINYVTTKLKNQIIEQRNICKQVLK